MGQDIRRTAAVAADYNALQGLITASTGVGLMLLTTSPSYATIVIALGVVLGTSWYQKHIGRSAGRGSLLRSVALAVGGVAVCLVATTVDRVTDLPVLLLPLVAAGVLAAGFRIGYRHVGVTPVHWAVVGLLALGALLPLVGVSTVPSQRANNLYGSPADTGALIALGGAMIVVGVADHVRLVRAMRPIPHD